MRDCLTKKPGESTGATRILALFAATLLLIDAAPLSAGSLVPYLGNFPPLPNPLVIRDWKQTALDYNQLAFNPSITGPLLPLLHEYTANTAAGYSGPAFGLPSYVGNPPGGGEALSVLGATLGGTLAGLDMAAFNGVTDRAFNSARLFIRLSTATAWS